jgi:hypothetical protein
MSAPWYSVKCLFHHPTRKAADEDFLYEERITLWRASSFEEAHRLAEEEARQYASEAKCVFVASTDSFHLCDGELSPGTEAYSAMRGSNLQPATYRSTFCVTSRDRLKPLHSDEKRANQAPEPTTTSVTIRANARLAPAAVVAHL